MPEPAPELPQRQRPAQCSPVFRFNRSTILYVTICTKDRRKILANDIVHQALLKAFTKADHWLVGLYVIMPDHIHLFCAPATQESLNVRKWAEYVKSLISKQVGWGTDHWLYNCWDTQIRNGLNHNEKWDYVYHNPVRAGLVEQPEDWPYLGIVNDLVWFDP